jgi:hypothetical protein
MEFNMDGRHCELWKHDIVHVKAGIGYACYLKVTAPTFEGSPNTACRVDSDGLLANPKPIVLELVKTSAPKRKIALAWRSDRMKDAAIC